MHRESKCELTDRLRREGRLDQFKKRREGLKAAGVPAKEAWWQAATEFPPVSSNVSNGSVPKFNLGALQGKPAVKIVDAAAWVFENLDCDWITPADAPSAGAWSLLQWARSSMMARGEFYRNFANKVVAGPQAAQRKAEDEHQEKRRKADANVHAMIDGLLEDRRKKQEEPASTR